MQVHPDAESMAFHLQLLREHISGASDDAGPIDVTVTNHIFGSPNDAVLELLEEVDPGVPMTHQASTGRWFHAKFGGGHTPA